MAGKQHFTGTVTKIHETFGFIDDEVFFQFACCEGKIPVVGDRVVVDAQFNPGMPFKWNASRVKFLGRQQQQHAAVAQMQAYNAMQNASQHNRQQFPQGLKFVHGGGAGLLGAAPSAVISQRLNQPRQQMSGPKGNRGSGGRPAGHVRRQSPQKRNRDNKDQNRRRTKTPPPHKGSSERQTSISKDDKNQRRPAPRYMIQYTKRPLTMRNTDVLSIKSLHHNMYIPSDFYAANFNWQDAFGLTRVHNPRKCKFHIFQKDVAPLDKLEDGTFSPPDADHTWVAKVMLLQAPPKDETYKQCCRLAEATSEHFLHQSRVYKFLVGNKGKKELMAIGGSWSPSLDGCDPAKNPRALVNTAIRTCKALTGIDLSKCTNWRRMLEIQYHRDAEIRKGQAMPDRVETTVIFLPDVHSCMPTSIEYASLRDSYLNKCEAVIQAEQEEITPDPPASQQSTMKEEPQPTALDAENADDNTDQKKTDEAIEEPAIKKEPKTEETLATPVKEDRATDESMDTTTPETSEGTPTHHSKLNVKTMKVQLLRKELESRGLSPRGLKAALVSRLSEAVVAEAQKETDDKLLLDEEDVEMQVLDEAGEKDEPETKTDDQVSEQDTMKKDVSEEKDSKNEQEEPKAVKTEVDEKKEKEDSPKKEPEKKKIDPEKLRQHYTLPDSHPIIPVHPNSEYKKGSFECTVTPLSNLLGYRHEDNKESIFEVSLFAEAFAEMLQRDHALNIYKALCNPLPELVIEKEEDKKETKEEKENGNDDDDEPKAKKSKSESEEDGKKSDGSKKSEKDGEGEKSDKSQSEDGKKQEKSTKDQDSKSRRHSSHKSSHKPEEKMVTFRKDLLLSFVYFDQTQCGYIKSSDVADIIHSIGLGLSRSQINKVVNKYVKNDFLKYRKLTDVPVSQLEAYKELLDSAPEPDLDALTDGNKTLQQNITMNGDGIHAEPAESQGIVNFNGAVVDVKALQDKLACSEEDQANMETTIQNLKAELESTSNELSKTQNEKKTLETDYEETKEKLSQTQDQLKSTSDMKIKFEKTLKSVAKSIETVMPKEEEK